MRERKEVGALCPTSPTEYEAVRRDWTPDQVRRQLRRASGYRGLQEVTAAWLDQLDDQDTGVIRLCAAGFPWKRICSDLGMSRATANRHLRYLLTVVAWNLNGRV